VPIEQALLDHAEGSAFVLFGRLEDESDRTPEVPVAGQVVSRPNEHRHVPVMAAGVHHAYVR
jgi:hypothetical protein